MFRILKGISKDCEFQFKWNDEIEEGEAVPKILKGLNCDEVKRVFGNWMKRLTWVIANGEEDIQE
jgi:hypothetical protein